MLVHHWSDDGMVRYHRRSLPHLMLRQLETQFSLLDVDDAHLDRHDRPLVEAAVGKIEELLSMRPAPIRIMLLVADDMIQSEKVLCESL